MAQDLFLCTCLWTERKLRSINTQIKISSRQDTCIYTHLPIYLPTYLLTQTPYNSFILSFFDFQGVMSVRRRVTLTVITVSVIFAVCWLTDSIYYIVVFYTSTLPFGDALNAITPTLIMFNSAINPIVYALINQRFRENMKLLMCCTCRPATNRIHPVREPRRMQVVNGTTHRESSNE